MMIEIDREKAAVYGITVDQVRQELLQRLRHPPGRDHLHADQRLSGHPGNASRNSSTDPSSLSNIFVKTNGPGAAAAAAGATAAGSGITGNGIPTGQSIPLSAVTKLVPTVGPLLVNHQGQQPAVTISFNLAPGFSLGEAVDGDPALEREFEPAGDDHDRLPGHGAGVPGFAEGAGLLILAAIFAAYRRARHPVRELHPPDHHHFRPAVGRHRRAADADAVRHGPVGDRHDRHRHAGRHRQEERDHDGRLRDRAPPRRAQRRGRDPRGLRCCASGRS